MNPKLKKTIAIAGLIFMGLFLVSMLIYLVNKTLFGGMLWLFAVLCFALALASFCAIYFTGGFPSQQAKTEEFKRVEAAYFKKMEEEAAAKEAEEAAAKEAEEAVQLEIEAEQDEASPDKQDE